MTADRIADALDLLTRAVETHDGAPADTNLARAQVLATIAVAEQLAKLTQAVAAQHGPPAPATHTGGQAETAPEQPGEPVLTLSDRWKDRDGESWRVAAMGEELRLALGHPGYPGYPCTWGEVDGEHGPLTLVQRAGYRPTGGTVPAGRLTIGMVVSHPDWVGGAPVRLTAPRRRDDERAYELLGDGEAGAGVAGVGALFTVWEPAGGAR